VPGTKQTKFGNFGILFVISTIIVVDSSFTSYFHRTWLVSRIFKIIPIVKSNN
jgi:hypothetical protein